MFPISTKVVVIGSGVKRKSGPRVGSIGFITENTTRPFNIGYKNINAYNINILFTRYGYEKKQRLELKSTIVLAPASLSNKVNQKKLLNKLIRTTKSLTNSVLVLAPTHDQSILSRNELNGRIISNLISSEFSSVYSNIINKPIKLKKNNVQNTSKIKSILGEDLLSNLARYHVFNLESKKRIISDIICNPEMCDKLFKVFCLIKALKVKNQSTSSIFMGSTNIVSLIFDDIKLKACIRKYKKMGMKNDFLDNTLDTVALFKKEIMYKSMLVSKL